MATGDDGDVMLILRPIADPLAAGLVYPERPVDQRLRLLLKAALRSWGFRCVEVRPAKPEEVDHVRG